jgi:hypothetical protein
MIVWTVDDEKFGAVVERAIDHAGSKGLRFVDNGSGLGQNLDIGVRGQEFEQA